MSPARALIHVLTARAPSVPVAICRIGLGIAAFGRSLKTARDLYLLAYDPSVVSAPVAAWSPRLDTIPEIVLVGGLGIVASLTLTVGWRASLSAATLAASIAFLYFVDYNLWANHMYFLALMLLLLSFAESDAALSVRQWRGGGGVDVPLWPVLLMKIQLSLVYFFSGVAKINPVFLSGYVLETRIILPEWLHFAPLVWTLAAATVAVELFLAVALWLPRLRVPALFVGIVLHVLVPATLGLYAGLVVFSVATLALYPLFFDLRLPAEPRAAAGAGATGLTRSSRPA